MDKKMLILVPSDMMDRNRKKDRNEDSLIRMSARARDNLGFDEDKVSIFSKEKNSVDLNIFKAFVEDIKNIRNMSFTEEEKNRIAFVTTNNYNKIVKENNADARKIWVSKELKKIVFGADPEFLIYDKNEIEIVPAYTLLNHFGDMGSDGAMAEVRPAPTHNPEDLVTNIRNIFTSKNYEQIVNNYVLKAACYVKTDKRDYPVGGHIHIGNPCEILKVDADDRSYIFRTINRILDELVSVPLIKLDGKEQGSGRRVGSKTSSKGGYGFFGEYRTAGEGVDFRLEHRTLSGLWLMHPTVAKAVLGTTKAVIDEIWTTIINKNFDLNYVFPKKYSDNAMWKKGFDMWKTFPICKDFNCIASSDIIIKQLHESDPTFIDKEYLEGWLTRMRSMSVYSTYQEYIELLYEILSINSKEIQQQDRTIQKNWIENKKFIIS